MSKVSEFYGITIEINPLEGYLSHILATYEDYEATFSARSGGRMDGEFPEDQNKLVIAWVLIHQKEIAKNWHCFLADNSYVMNPIAPLI